MPPKVKITKEDIINAAVSLVRENGADALNARTVASLLGCSTQPVFSNFATMDELRLAVVEKADEICNEYIKKEIEIGDFPAYKASGMAYIRFAKEEKELFRLLYMRDRTGEKLPATLEVKDDMQDIIHKNTGLDGDKLKLFHFEMWAYVHGIATMFATEFVNLSWELVSQMLTDAYKGLRKHYETE
ncbi:MAG: TetR/AcrR family transcriptional regulator [Clostridia bacterium]|nr:TetR/AcrR family transcriptional regulator [Clostridia bacterium]